MRGTRILDLIDFEEPIADRMVALGLTRRILDDVDPGRDFVFDVDTCRQLRVKSADRVSIEIACRILDVIQCETGESDARACVVGRWLSFKAPELDRETFELAVSSVKTLVWYLLKGNLKFEDLRALAHLVNCPEAFFARARRFQARVHGAAVIGLNEPDWLEEKLGVSVRASEALMMGADEELERAGLPLL